MKKQIIPFILALCLSACGFHLRGMIDVPKWLSNIAIISKDGDTPLVDLLSSQLENYKIEVNPNPSQAHYLLIINSVRMQQQIMSIGASTNPRQYQLIMTVEFTLQTRKGEIIKAPRSVVVTRPLTINNNRILGSNDEEAILIEEMQQEASIQIINRLSHK
jgi:LPS-assembly lipoprotein